MSQSNRLHKKLSLALRQFATLLLALSFVLVGITHADAAQTGVEHVLTSADDDCCSPYGREHAEQSSVAWGSEAAAATQELAANQERMADDDCPTDGCADGCASCLCCSALVLALAPTVSVRFHFSERVNTPYEFYAIHAPEGLRPSVFRPPRIIA